MAVVRIVLEEVSAQFARLYRLRLEYGPALRWSNLLLLLLLVRRDRFFQGFSNDQVTRLGAV